MHQYKTIGIIGGQGPTSTAEFYNHVIGYFQAKLGADFPSDFPPIVIFSTPTPGPDANGVEDTEGTFTILADTAKKLERDGCDFIFLVCNSLQFLLPRLQIQVRVPIIPMANVVADYIQDKPYNTVGVLGTPTTLKENLYGLALQKQGKQVVLPDAHDQQLVMRTIIRKIAGTTRSTDKGDLVGVVERLQAKGAEAVLLACTELPLIISPKESPIPAVDCNELYALRASELSSRLS